MLRSVGGSVLRAKRLLQPVRVATASASRFAGRMRAPLGSTPFSSQFSVSSLCGHAAFVLAGTAFLEPDILNLRVLSVASGAATCIFSFYHPVGQPLWLPFGWNLVFIAINASRIRQILTERYEADNLPAVAVQLWRAALAPHGVTSVEFSRLLNAATVTTLRKDTEIQKEGAESNSIFLLVRGGAVVTVDGNEVHTLGPHQFVGDMGLSSGVLVKHPVRGVATVTTTAQTTCIAWPRLALYDLLKQSPKLAASFQAAVAADTLRKLAHDASEEGFDPSLSHRLWRARYASVMHAMLEDGEVSLEERRSLRSFRQTHQIDEAEHSAVLAACGWTPAQFAAGENARMRRVAERRAEREDAMLARSEAEQVGLESGADLLPLSSGGGGATVSSLPPGTVLELWDERSELVVALQERLNVYFGVQALLTDGHFGPLTAQAVELHQAQRGLTVDGKVGPATWEALRRRHLNRDFDEINDVNMALLQQKLKLVMGEEFGSLQADGINGPRTQAALQAFLKRHNLKQDSRRGSDGPDAAPPPRELSPQATALLRESYLGELEANSLRAAAQATGAKPPPDAGIKLLQLVLNQVMRREVVTVDGVYGPRTRTAIDDFQKLFGLPVDGDVAAQLKTVAQALRAEKGPGAGQSEPAGGGAASATSPTTRPR